MALDVRPSACVPPEYSNPRQRDEFQVISSTTRGRESLKAGRGRKVGSNVFGDRNGWADSRKI
jgi:hypothetical protein